MRWYQVDSNAPNDPKIKRLIGHGLLAGKPEQAAAHVGRLFLVWCYVANYGESDPGLAIRGDGTNLPYDEMAHEVLFPDEQGLFVFLDVLADIGLIHPDLWRHRRTVLLPAMWARACEYYQQKQRPISRHKTADELAAAIMAGDVPVRPKAATITDAQRQRIYKRDGLACRYCRMDLDGQPKQRCIDHVIPFIQDGLSEDDNLVTCCKPCNARKGGRTPEQAGMVLHPVNGGSTGGQPPADITINNQPKNHYPPDPSDQAPPADLLTNAGETAVDALVRVWNTERKPGPIVRDLTDSRRAAFGKAVKVQQDLAVWRLVVRWLNTQPWCNGRGSGDHANWTATLDWLAKSGTLARYHDKALADGRFMRAEAGQGTSQEGRNAAKGRTGFKRGEFAAALEGGDDAGKVH